MRLSFVLASWMLIACDGEPPPTLTPSATSAHPEPPALIDPDLTIDPPPRFPELPAEAGRILSGASRLEVLALGERSSARDAFDGRRVLARVSVDAYPIVGVLERGLVTSGPVPLCFEPHHGVRAVSEEGTLELSICFGCSQLHVLGSAGPYTPISSAELERRLSGAIEAAHPLRFIEGEGSIGHWVR